MQKSWEDESAKFSIKASSIAFKLRNKLSRFEGHEIFWNQLQCNSLQRNLKPSILQLIQGQDDKVFNVVVVVLADAKKLKQKLTTKRLTVAINLRNQVDWQASQRFKMSGAASAAAT